ncbi:unnamed protein product [Owenia fusiformis]|uniref:G-protein coupled receptors family 1 profile domain-containing protein n=1 Tax=Owenia fusiformis TaxID=6347 RepID=A0A8S4N3R3_OWEFU|nr:unnamed protein product [Owenia fusiformis]
MEEFTLVMSTTNETDVADPNAGETSKVELYIVMVILCIFTIVGTAGNGLVIYVYSRKKDKLTSTLFILVLAVTDFMTCLIIVPYTIVMEYMGFIIGDHDLACKVYQFLITCNVPFSAFIMAAIAVDRYLCICHPFLHAMNPFRAKLIVFALLILAFSLGTFTSLAFGVYNHKTFNETYTTVNVTSLGNVTRETTIEVTRVVLNGACAGNTLILSNAILLVYQKVYTSLYAISFVIVVVLYTLIVYSVLIRMRMRQRQKRSVLLKCEMSTNSSPSCLPSETVALNGSNLGKNGHSIKDPKGFKRKASKKDKNVMANLRMAMMLFVVTLVFIVAFLPAFLMALELIPYSLVVFYMYFAYNVANPIIYSFMNRNFRDDLKKIFNCL